MKLKDNYRRMCKMRLIISASYQEGVALEQIMTDLAVRMIKLPKMSIST